MDVRAAQDVAAIRAVDGREDRPLMFRRVIGPLDRRRPKEDLMREVRQSTNDPASSGLGQGRGAVIPKTQRARAARLAEVCY